MSIEDNKYIEAAKKDYDTLKGKWSEMSANWQTRIQEGRDRMDSEVAETAWKDFEDKSEKLRAAGANASDDLRNAYESARDKVRSHLNG